MDDTTSLKDLHGYVLECLPSAPVARRIRLLNTLAQVIGSSAVARELRAEAEDLQRAEDRHKQLVLNFRGALK